VLATKLRNQRLSRKEVEEPTYTYATVEAALGKVFQASARTLPVLRARLKGFQRVGLTPSSPGRGKVIRYRKTHIYTWALALALADFGLGPEPIFLLLVEATWFDDWYFPMMQAIPPAKPPFFEEEHLYFALMPHVLTPARAPSIVQGYDLFDRLDRKPLPTFGIFRGSWISAERLMRLGRVAFIDLTAIKNAVDAAI
jgi:hypothetical protein